MSTPDDIKTALNIAIDEAVKASKEYFIDGSHSFTRKRKLTMEKVVRLLLTMTGGSLHKELYTAGYGDISASAFCQRRQKIVSTVFEDVFNYFNKTATPDINTFRGYRVFAVDGTTINMARNPKSSTFLQDGGRGYNAFHLNPIFDILNQIYFSAVIQPQPRMDEIGALTAMLLWNDFPKKSIIILDRGYESYNMIAHLLNTQNIDFVMRVKQNKAAMREIQKLPMANLDTIVSQIITTSQRNVDKQENRIFLQTGSKKGKVNGPGTRITRWDFPSPYPLSFRVVRRQLPRTEEFETLVTSLSQSEFPADDIVALYSQRWCIESQFKALKYTVGIANLHSKKDDLVRQEIWAAMTIQNFCSRIVSNVILQQKDANKYDYAVNYKMAVMFCKEFLRDPYGNSAELMRNIARYTEPIRPGRQDERNLRVKSFPGFCYRIAA